uniref:hypothetical protein n=1 Tax=Cephaleuros parasiticus TaxID=173370 RepID=UPI001EDF0D3D|nr:hypothetical protein MFQ79_pgp094 [Cephaleuros parasiticus]UIB38968.1 hypothetical protein [Cephaleuros parasiticus]
MLPRTGGLLLEYLLKIISNNYQGWPQRSLFLGATTVYPSASFRAKPEGESKNTELPKQKKSARKFSKGFALSANSRADFFREQHVSEWVPTFKSLHNSKFIHYSAQ